MEVLKKALSLFLVCTLLLSQTAFAVETDSNSTQVSYKFVDVRKFDTETFRILSTPVTTAEPGDVIVVTLGIENHYGEAISARGYTAGAFYTPSAGLEPYTQSYTGEQLTAFEEDGRTPLFNGTSFATVGSGWSETCRNDTAGHVNFVGASANGTNVNAGATINLVRAAYLVTDSAAGSTIHFSFDPDFSGNSFSSDKGYLTFDLTDTLDLTVTGDAPEPVPTTVRIADASGNPITTDTISAPGSKSYTAQVLDQSNTVHSEWNAVLTLSNTTGFSLSGNTVTVASTAVDGSTATLTASYENLTTATVTITASVQQSDAVPNGIRIVDSAENELGANDTIEIPGSKTYIAQVLDQNGNVNSEWNATFSLDTKGNSGFTLDDSTTNRAVLNVSADAANGASVTLNAIYSEGEFQFADSLTITATETERTPTSIRIVNASGIPVTTDTISVPGNRTYTAQVLDQNGNPNDAWPADLILSESAAGFTLDEENGTVTVAEGTANGATATVTASYGTLTPATLTITASAEEPSDKQVSYKFVDVRKFDTETFRILSTPLTTAQPGDVIVVTLGVENHYGEAISARGYTAGAFYASDDALEPYTQSYTYEQLTAFEEDGRTPLFNGTSFATVGSGWSETCRNDRAGHVNFVGASANGTNVNAGATISLVRAAYLVTEAAAGSTVHFSFDPAFEGTSFSSDKGYLTFDLTHTLDLTVIGEKQPSVPHSIRIINGAGNTVTEDTINTSDSRRYTAQVLDQYGEVNADWTATLSMPETEGFTFTQGASPNTGLVTVASDATGGATVTLTASYTGLTPATVTITVYQPLVPTTIQIVDSESKVIQEDTIDVPDSKTYTAQVLDQNGNVNSEWTAELSLSKTSGFTFTAGETSNTGTVTVAEGTPNGTQATLTATYPDLTSATVTITANFYREASGMQIVDESGNQRSTDTITAPGSKTYTVQILDMNNAVMEDVVPDNIELAGDGFTMSIDGSNVTISVADNIPNGSTATLTTNYGSNIGASLTLSAVVVPRPASIQFLKNAGDDSNTGDIIESDVIEVAHSQRYTAQVLDQTGNVHYNWIAELSLSDTTGFVLTPGTESNTALVSVAEGTPDAVQATLTATYQPDDEDAEPVTAELTLTSHLDRMPTSIRIVDENGDTVTSDDIDIPGSKTYRAEILDQSGTPNTEWISGAGEKFTFGLAETVNGFTFAPGTPDGTGTVTVSASAEDEAQAELVATYLPEGATEPFTTSIILTAHIIPVATSIRIVDENGAEVQSDTVPIGGSKVYTAQVLDQKGIVNANWTATLRLTTAEGFTFTAGETPNTGTVSVAPGTVESTSAKLTASYLTLKIAEATLTAHEIHTPTTVRIVDASGTIVTADTITVPGSKTYTAQVLDEAGTVHPDWTATLTLSETAGFSLNNGTVTLDSTAVNGATATLTASYTGLTSATVIITASAEPVSAPATVRIVDASGSAITADTIYVPGSTFYAAQVLDEAGTVHSEWTATLTLSETAGFSLNNGTVTVAEGTANGATATLTASYENLTPATVTITARKNELSDKQVSYKFVDVRKFDTETFRILSTPLTTAQPGDVIVVTLGVENHYGDAISARGYTAGAFYAPSAALTPYTQSYTAEQLAGFEEDGRTPLFNGTSFATVGSGWSETCRNDTAGHVNFVGASANGTNVNAGATINLVRAAYLVTEAAAGSTVQFSFDPDFSGNSFSSDKGYLTFDLTDTLDLTVTGDAPETVPTTVRVVNASGSVITADTINVPGSKSYTAQVLDQNGTVHNDWTATLTLSNTTGFSLSGNTVTVDSTASNGATATLTASYESLTPATVTITARKNEPSDKQVSYKFVDVRRFDTETFRILSTPLTTAQPGDVIVVTLGVENNSGDAISARGYTAGAFYAPSAALTPYTQSYTTEQLAGFEEDGRTPLFNGTSFATVGSGWSETCRNDRAGHVNFVGASANGTNVNAGATISLVRAAYLVTDSAAGSTVQFSFDPDFSGTSFSSDKGYLTFDLTDTLDLTVTGGGTPTVKSPTSVRIVDASGTVVTADTITVPGMKAYTAQVLDQDGTVHSEWPATLTISGNSGFTLNNGNVIVAEGTPNGATATLTASYGTLTPATLTITASAPVTPVPTAVRIVNASGTTVTSDTIEVSGSKTYTAEVLDQIGTVHSEWTATFNLSSTSGFRLNNGTVSVLAGTSSGTQTTLTATYPGLTPATVTITAAASRIATSIRIVDSNGNAVTTDTISAPGSKSYTAQVLDQYGSPNDAWNAWNATFRLSNTPGFSLDNGTVTVDSTAVNGSTAVLTASYENLPPATVTITANVPEVFIPTSVRIVNESGTAITTDTISAPGSKLYTAQILDQNGTVRSEWTASFTLSGTTGFTLDNGTVTIDSTAVNGSTAVLTASYENLTPATLTITAEVLVPTSIRIVNIAGTAVTADTINVPGIKAYTAQVLDQRGTIHSEWTASFSLSNTTGFTLSNGTVSVAEGTRNNTTATLTASYGTLTPATVTITAAIDRVATSIRIVDSTGAEVKEDTITVPGNKTYTAQVLDQEGTPNDEWTATLSMSSANGFSFTPGKSSSGETLSNTGTVTLAESTSHGTPVTLTASYTGLDNVTAKVTASKTTAPDWNLITFQDETHTIVYGSSKASAFATALPYTASNGTYRIDEPDATLPVGDHTITVTFTAASGYQERNDSQSYTLTVIPRSVRVTGLTAENRPYDGTNEVTLSGGTLSGLISGDTNRVSLKRPLGKGTVSESDKYPGDNKPVTIPEGALTLTGDAAGNYTLVPPTDAVTVNITPDPEIKIESSSAIGQNAEFDAVKLDRNTTKVEGLEHSAYSSIYDAVENTSDDIKTEITAEFTPISYREDTVKEFTVRIELTYSIIDESTGRPLPGYESTALHNLDQPVLVHLQIPAGFAPQWVRHLNSDGTTKEWIRVSVDNGVASWRQSSFSDVVLTDSNAEAKVTFDANGGKFADGALTKVLTNVESDNKAENPGYHLAALPSEVPTHDPGYGFTGWYTQAEGGERVTTSTVFNTAENTVYAHWSQSHTYTVTFDPNGGKFTSSVQTENGKLIYQVVDNGDGTLSYVNNGTLSALTALPTASRDKADNTTYTFDGWYDAPGGNNKISSVSDLTTDMTLYAHWNTKTSGSTGGTTGGSTRRSSSGGGGSSSYGPYVTVNNSSGGTATVSGNTVTIKPADGYRVANVTVNGQLVTLPASGVLTVNSYDNVAVQFERITNPFTDISPDRYYYDAVLWAVYGGVTNGTTATTFAPYESCTRAQMVTFLWRAVGSPTPVNTRSPFIDVQDTSRYYYNAVLWAVENGITNGTTDNTFEPNEHVTRAQSVTFLYRMSNARAVSGANPFIDVAPTRYYYDAVLWALANGITNGTTATTFEPSEDCTRAQIVTFLYRYNNNIGIVQQ